MDGLVDAPAFVVVALTLAAILLLVEIALPTFGVAGVSGLALLVAGAVAIDRQEDAWWPLSLVAVAVGLWAVLLVRRAAPPAGRLLRNPGPRQDHQDTCRSSPPPSSPRG